MLVVKTTSPAISPSPAKLHPWKAAPSSRTSVALHRPWLCLPLRACTKLCSSSVVYQFSTNYSTHDPALQRPSEIGGVGRTADECTPPYRPLLRDRKSTRLNSSHANISYAVFCLQTNKLPSRHC